VQSLLGRQTLALVTALLLVSCGKKEEAPAPAPAVVTPAAAPAPAPAQEPAPGEDGDEAIEEEPSSSVGQQGERVPCCKRCTIRRPQGSMTCGEVMCGHDVCRGAR
jgi:hypothetical protein